MFVREFRRDTLLALRVALRAAAAEVEAQDLSGAEVRLYSVVEDCLLRLNDLLVVRGWD